MQKQSRSFVFLPLRVCCFLAIFAVVFIVLMPLKVSGEIKWRLGQVIIPKLERQEITERIAELAGRPNMRHVVIQLNRPIGTEEREQLRKGGLNLLRYLGNRAFFASFSAKVVNPRVLSAMPFLVGLMPIEREWKQHPRILAGNVPSWASVGKDSLGAEIVAIYVLFHPDVSLFSEAISVVKRHGAVIRDELKSINGLIIELPVNNIDFLADEDAVQWIEWPLPRMSEINDSNRAVTEANIVQATPYNLDGSGVTVLVYDAGTARPGHVDFENRLTERDSSGMSDHATHVSGIVGGAGIANSAYEGMAPGVIIESYGFEYDGSGIFLYSNPGDIESDYNEAINLYGAKISNNSIGTNTETNGFDCASQGDYGVTAALIDAIVGGSLGEPFRIVWAAGNERQGSRCDVEGYGAYYSIAPPAGAKNHITVGALNSNDDSMTSFSSWGPVDDGRMKPDVSAPGCQSNDDWGVTSTSSSDNTSYTTKCGTSMAAPTVCGLSALLLQDFRVQFPGKSDPMNSTLKILLAHNAEDLGNSGPDYQFGYGSVRIQKTIDFMRSGSFLENQVDQNGIFSASILVNSGVPELKITLAWDDVPGTPNIDSALVNDLDLRVFGPDSQQYYPWTLDQYNPGNPALQNQENHVDNIEQVFLVNPTPGVWRIEVHGFSVPEGPQYFSLCASPELAACSSRGTILLDSSKYSCSANAGIQVIDCDLDIDSGAIDEVYISITSDSDSAGESLLLTETGTETSDFRGTISLNKTDESENDGILVITEGDKITATYIDADDGEGGKNVLALATATVDCTLPVITNVQTNEIKPFQATVSFETDEPTKGTVRYGLSCDSLMDLVSGGEYSTAHSITLAPLTDNTQYFFVVDAVDQAGNTYTDDKNGTCYEFLTPVNPDYFTEIFSSDNDLNNLSLTFEPDGSNDFYSGCVQSIDKLPMDPTGSKTLFLYDDSYSTITLSDEKTMSFYNNSYDTFYVGSNGYITFSEGDGDNSESPADHFDLPRISALFDDLNPNFAGTVSWKQLNDRVVVSWLNVPQYGESDSNTFQVQMFFDGTIIISYLSIDAADGMVGLSAGSGQPFDFYESDLSAMENCDPSCYDGIQNQDEDLIDCGGQCSPCGCLSNDSCDDKALCNGTETCDEYGFCQPGADPCPAQFCDSVRGCVDCFIDADCDDGQFCNGTETCNENGNCQPGENPCSVKEVCDEDNANCCLSIVIPNCGNGVCETYAGEDCVSCPDDCNGKLGGKPSKRYCCGSQGQIGVSCDDIRCTEGDNTCSDVSSCCGDGICEGAEDSYNCGFDCGQQPFCGNNICDPGENFCDCSNDCGVPSASETNCSDGIDNDCDTWIDCEDTDCSNDPICAGPCLQRKEACSSDEECCSGRCFRNACK